MLTPLAAVQEQLLARLAPIAERISCPLNESVGKVLAEHQQAAFDAPSLDCSAMDGFAVCAADIAKGNVAENVHRIFTGGAMPSATDAVIPQENASMNDNGELILKGDTSVSTGQYVRKAGEDFMRGSRLLSSGCRLSPHDIGILAAMGSASVPIYRPLRVGVISTGDELVALGGQKSDSARYDINSRLLSAFLHKVNMEVVEGGIVSDERELLRGAIKDLLAQGVDCIISSGGASVGDKDYMRSILSEEGELDLWGVALRPGKPFAFGLISDKPIFVLPGNPASVLVLWCMLLRACLLKMQGCGELHINPFESAAEFDCPADAREQILRCSVIQTAANTWTASAPPAQSSGTISGFAQSNALLSVPAGQSVKAGDKLATWWLKDFYS